MRPPLEHSWSPELAAAERLRCASSVPRKSAPLMIVVGTVAGVLVGLGALLRLSLLF